MPFNWLLAPNNKHSYFTLQGDWSANCDVRIWMLWKLRIQFIHVRSTKHQTKKIFIFFFGTVVCLWNEWQIFHSTISLYEGSLNVFRFIPFPMFHAFCFFVRRYCLAFYGWMICMRIDHDIVSCLLAFYRPKRLFTQKRFSSFV